MYRIFGGGNNLLGGSIMDMLMDEITNNPEVIYKVVNAIIFFVKLYIHLHEV